LKYIFVQETYRAGSRGFPAVDGYLELGQ